MADESKKPSEDEIIAAYNSGELAGKIFSYDYSYSDSAVEVCVKLHNEGKLNLLSLIGGSTFGEIDAHRFFAGQHFFCEAIPSLASSTEEMMVRVRELVRKGGQDGAATFPYHAFQKWCEKDLERSKHIVMAINLGDELAREFATCALVAGKLIDDAKMHHIVRANLVCSLSGICCVR